MRTDKILLIIDFIINLILGILPLLNSENLAGLLGVPVIHSAWSNW